MIRTVWVWMVGIVLMVVLGILVILVSFLDRRGTLTHRFAQLWARGILAAAGVEVQIEGVENLPSHSPVILASNHQGYFDIFTLFAHIPVRFGWLTKKELFRIPVLGYAMKRFGNVRIDRSDRHKARQSLIVAAESVRAGQSVIIFPEGTRSPDGQVLPFKKGCFYLAEASGAPVVPISISGSHEVMPKKSFRVRPGTIHVVIGQPLLVQGIYDHDRNGFTEKLREIIVENRVPVR